ncbi:hypothetical protein HYALB_00003159 [Hymenoscyphus albidus]|uniref:Uncharacterized protein n=1 Tax=Hymenoscyphus albidus TaxID=595503 RepID=A0A9N9LHK7_9HELO|nr:hypothetical protein HYALB_00003159 [Hymenoscyphus albidus]
MPRPKRTKVQPSAVRSKGPVHATAKKIESHAPKPAFDELYDVSDPEERITTTTRSSRKGNDRGKAAATPLGRAKKVDATQEKDMELDVEKGDDLDIDLGSSSDIEVSRRDINTPAVGNSSMAFGNIRRRPREPSILGRGTGRARSSSVESDMADDNGLTSVGKINTPATAFGGFRGRTRQPSVSGRITTVGGMGGGTPARVGSAMKIGNFRRRAREPSLLGTARKQQQARPEFDDEDDFNPEDESTPLNLSKARAMNSSSGASGSNSRKRKLADVQIPQSQSSPTRRSPAARQEDETIPATASAHEDEGENEEENEEDELPELDEDRPMPSIEARPVTPEPMSETMAPPLSSSSASSPELPDPATLPLFRGRRPLRGKTPPPRTQDSPISSPPSLTHSPNRPYIASAKTKAKTKPKKAPPPPATYSTAQLQALLPRRRRHTTRDPFDIPSSDDEIDASGLASDDDELSHLNARTRRQRSVIHKAPVPTRKSGKEKAAPKTTTRSTAKRTYGSRGNPISDKENEEADVNDSLGPVPDAADESPENSQEMEARIGKELKKARRKFQEVDKWELEFEDATGSSSPKDAR